jgi:ATP-dependent Clp protease ATP-binding subunit ClpA
MTTLPAISTDIPLVKHQFVYASGALVLVHILVDQLAQKKFKRLKDIVVPLSLAAFVLMAGLPTAHGVCLLFLAVNASTYLLYIYKPQTAGPTPLPPELTDLVAEAEHHPEWEYCYNPDAFIRDVTVALLHPTKKSVMMIGKQGCGKTAYIEHLAWRIYNKKFLKGHTLENRQLVVLDHLKISSGDGLVGTSQAKLDRVVEFIKQKNVLCAVDEAHLLIGQNRVQYSTSDTANYLKPMAARGEIRLIGATTPQEYEYFQSDPAFKRRWHPHRVDDMTPEQALEALKMKKAYFENHYHVTIHDLAFTTAVEVAKNIQDNALIDVATDLICLSCGRAVVNNPPSKEITFENIMECAKQKRLLRH